MTRIEIMGLLIILLVFISVVMAVVKGHLQQWREEKKLKEEKERYRKKSRDE